MDIRFCPFQVWNATTTTKRKSGSFQVGYAKGLEDMERELQHLGASQIIVSTGHTPSDIRQDGWPRSSTRKPWHPGVALHFVSRHGPLTFACDTYDEWQGNIRAIGLTLEALRAIERHGATRSGAQYRGYAALPAGEKVEPPTPPPTPPRDTTGPARDPRTAAAKLLLAVAGRDITEEVIREVLQGGEALQRVYRAASMGAHPDTGGTNERFHEVTAAMEFLRGGKA